MSARRVVVVGETLFVETLARMLACAGGIEVAACAPDPVQALPLVRAASPDAVIVAATVPTSSLALGQLLEAFPDLPVLRADLSGDSLQLITSRRVRAQRADLLAALAALPSRR